MEVEKLCYHGALLHKIIFCSVLDTFLAAQKSLLLLSGALLSDINVLAPLPTAERFSSGDCKKSEQPKDASETGSDSDDDDVDNDDDNDEDDDYSGEESDRDEDTDDEVVKANGAAGSDDDEDSDDDDGDDDGDDSDDDDDDDEDEDDSDEDGVRSLKKKK